MARRNQGKINRLVPPDTSYSHNGIRTARVVRIGLARSPGSAPPTRSDQGYTLARVGEAHPFVWNASHRTKGSVPYVSREAFPPLGGSKLLRSKEAGSFIQMAKRMPRLRRALGDCGKNGYTTVL